MSKFGQIYWISGTTVFLFLSFCIAEIASKHLYFRKIFRGGLCTPNPPPGLRPWTPLGAAPPDPPCNPPERSARCACLARSRFASLTTGPPGKHMPPWLNNLATPLVQPRPKRSKIAKTTKNCYFHDFCQLWGLTMMRADL